MDSLLCWPSHDARVVFVDPAIAQFGGSTLLSQSVTAVQAGQPSHSPRPQCALRKKPARRRNLCACRRAGPGHPPT
eukprot:6326855-Lingulodinium_polyedra.AAC.1